MQHFTPRALAMLPAVARAVLALPPSKTAKLTLTGSYARQSDYKNTPFSFDAACMAGEAGLAVHGFTGTLGYGKLGSDNGLHAVFTPMATLHKFNGWADVFLGGTPAKGLQDAYGGIACAFPGVTAVKGLNAQLSYHQYDSDVGAVSYGHEWNAVLGLKTGRVTWLAKYADYTASGFGVNTRKFWLQAGSGF